MMTKRIISLSFIAIAVIWGIVAMRFVNIHEAQRHERDRLLAAAEAADKYVYGKVLLNSRPMQGTCQAGYYFYQNASYSLCYPKPFKAYADDSVIDPASGKMERDVVELVDRAENAVISILPSYNADAGDEACLRKEKVIVAGLPAERQTRYETVDKGCGKPVSVATIIDIGEKAQFWLIYQAYEHGSLRFLREYPKIEQSLSIK